MRIDGAIFDLDGTILDSAPMWREAVLELLEDGGAPDPGQVYAQVESVPLVQMCRLLNERYGMREEPECILRDLRRRALEGYRQRVRPVEGARELLLELHDAGIHLAVASSTSADLVREALEVQGLLGLFELVVSAEGCGKGKGYPDVYLEAAQRLGCDVSATWVFEDDPLGLGSARRAGFPTVCVYSEGGGRDRALCEDASTIFSHGYVDVSLALIRDLEPVPPRTRGTLRALVVDGSPEPSSPGLVARLARDADYVVAADRGAEALCAAGVVPDAFCGDFDSVGGSARAWAEGVARTRIAFPSQKYSTDLAIAIACARNEAARRREALELTLCCASGGRSDHALAVVGQLASAADARPRLVEDGFECRVLSPTGRPSWELGPEAQGRTLSAIALSPGCVLSERGLRWELDHRALPLLGDEGVSNVVCVPDASVTCHEGVLAVFLVS